MATVEIPDSLFKRLQAFAVPLVDNTASVLDRVVDFYESHRNSIPTQKIAKGQIWKGESGVRKCDSDAPPDLRHTRVLSARFAGRTASGWNKLVHFAHIEGMSRLGSTDALRAATKSNFISGRPSSEDVKKGYRHIPEIDISIQNVDAEHAWSNTLRLARHLNVGVRVDFEWMQKTDAAHPGEQGCLEYEPS